jgi:osmoprotectant transport system substrate-binding protein
MARLRFVVGLGFAVLSAPLCWSAIAQAIVVGAKEFTEQLLVAELTTQLLAARGYDIHKGTGFGTDGLRTLQESGVIDLYWEYTGTALSNFHQDTARRARDDGYERVRALDAKRGLVWLAPSKVNNTYSLAMRREDAAAKGIRSISDLATKVRRGEGIRVASTVEFPARPDGLKAVQQAYRFEFMLGFVVAMDSGAVYRALRRNSEFDVGVVFATDGRIAAADLIVLRDDRGAFADYILAPVIRQTTLERQPAIKIVLESLSAVLDNDIMRSLNSAVDVRGRTLQEVASEFLRSRALIESP